MAQDTSCPPPAQVEFPLGVPSACQAIRIRTRWNQNSNGIRPRGDTHDDWISESIPLLELPQSVCWEDGRIDRVKLTSYLGIIPAEDEGDYESFRYHLGFLDNGMFLSSPDGGAGSRSIQIRSSDRARNGRRQPKPLFSGEVFTNSKQSLIALSSRLFLNPTQALRFYPSIRGNTQGVFETQSKPAGPRTLDGKLNCLPSSMSRAQYRLGERRYFENVFRSLESSISKAAEMSVLPTGAIRASEFGLKECEIYFEFHRPNAIEYLRSISEVLHEYGEETAKREHAPRTEAIDNETFGNSESVRVRLSKTEHLVVYTKTPNRLRFEVRFFAPSTNIVSRRTSPNLGGVFGIFDELRDRAANRVNSVLSYLHECAETPPVTIANDWRYKEAWYSATGWSAISDGFIGVLQTKGRISVRGFTGEEKRVIRRAKRKGLLSYAKERRAYVPVSDSIG